MAHTQQDEDDLNEGVSCGLALLTAVHHGMDTTEIRDLFVDAELTAGSVCALVGFLAQVAASCLEHACTVQGLDPSERLRAIALEWTRMSP